MACLSKEKGNCFRIHWKFKVRVGPRAGETIEGSLQLGRCTRAAAKARLREVDIWEESVKTGRHIPNESWESVYQLWLAEKSLAYTPRSLERANTVISLYTRWRSSRQLPCQTVDQVASRSDIIAWRNHRLDHEAGRKTVANDLGTLSRLFDWCVIEKYLTDNPVLRITRPRFVNKKEGVPLTRQQAGRWLRSIRLRLGLRDHGPRTWAEVRRKRQLAVFFLNTGVRNGELCSLNIEDLRVDHNSQLLYVFGKGQKERWVPLNRAALAAVRCHLRSRGNPRRGPLFVSPAGDRYNVRQLASEFVKTARGSDEEVVVNPHALRHTFASWLARSCSDVALTQKILGHENVNTTLKYYVHTSDHELAGATRNLGARSRKPQARTDSSADAFRVLPFPTRQVG